MRENGFGKRRRGWCFRESFHGMHGEKLGQIALLHASVAPFDGIGLSVLLRWVEVELARTLGVEQRAVFLVPTTPMFVTTGDT